MLESGGQNKPKKVVINNLRKSIMGGGGIGNSIAQQNQPNNLVQSSSFNNQQQINNTNEINRLNEQLTLYKQKNDQSLIKVRFLCDKLQSYGGLNSIPETIVNEISQTDLKIKNLQQLLYFRRSKQMRKLKKKIKKFVQLIQFDISQQDLNKIQDQVEIIFFLIDIFSQKYNHIMTEKTEIDHIVEVLKQDTVFNRQQLQQQNKFLKQKQVEQVHYIRDLELQLFNVKKDTNNILKSPSTLQVLMRNQSTVSSQNSKILEQTIKSLQMQNENYIAKIFKLQNTIKNNQYEIINYKRKVQNYENLLNAQKAKYIQLQDQLAKVQREESRWKERYELMQKQKNERIQLLQKQKRMIDNMNYNTATFSRDQYQSQPKRHPKIHINKINRFEQKQNFLPNYNSNVEDSGEEYFDMDGS